MLLKNTLYQLYGRISSLIFGLASVPTFLHFLGSEAYGVVGLYLSLIALTGLVDMGVPVSANRQISVLLSQKTPILQISKTVRSLEVFIWSVSAMLLIGLALSADYLASEWLNMVLLSVDEVDSALTLCAFAIALRFPVAFYNNCLFALNRHASANIVVSIAALFRFLFPVLLFWFFSPSLVLFFYSQILASVLEVLLCAKLVWRDKMRFFCGLASLEALRPITKMMGSLTGLSLTAIALSQLDKIVLSRLVTLDVFGVYSASYSIAMGLLPIAYSIGNASFPEIVKYKASDRAHDLQKVLRKSLILIIILTTPIASCFVFYSSELIGFAENFIDHGVFLLKYLPLLTVGAFVQCWGVTLHGALIAQGKPSGLFMANFSALLIFALVYVLSAYYHGVLGVCYAFIALNLWIFGVQVYLILSDGLFKEIWVGELRFAAKYLIISLTSYYALTLLIPNLNNSLAQIALMLSLFGILAAMQLLFYFGYFKWR